MTTFDEVADRAMTLPGIERSTSYGTPALKVRGKGLARLREDGESLAIKTREKEALLASDPETYFTTRHYDGYPYVLLRLPVADLDEVAELIEDAWREVAPKKLVAGYDAERADPADI